MSSSSSSDSEDDNRFREACDPSFSGFYERKHVKGTTYENNGEASPTSPTAGSCPSSYQDTDDLTTETRESFLLAKKVHNILASKKGITTNGSYLEAERFGPNLCSSLRRKGNTSSRDDMPSTLSPYLAKQLVKLLDKKVEIEKLDSNAEISPKENGGKWEMFLVKDMPIKSFLNNEETAVTKRKINTADNYDKKEIALRCQSIALSPQHILDQRNDYPWPHPKNIRYIERYRLKSRKPNGSMKVVPINDSNTTTNKKVKCKSVKTEKKMVNGQDIVVKKKRKQSKKRGGRKQKKKISGELDESTTFCNKS